MNFINNWVSQIVIAVIISTILLMLIPQNKNKKYIKVVISIYILAVILIPITNKLNSNKNINIQNILDKDYIKTTTDFGIKNLKFLDNYDNNYLEVYNNYTEKNILNIYANSLEKSIKGKLDENKKIKENKKYNISYVKVLINEENNNIDKVYILIKNINNENELNNDENNKDNENNENNNNNIKINDLDKVKIDNININNDIKYNIENNNNSDIDNVIDKNYENLIKEILYINFEISKDNIIVKGDKND